MDNFSPTGVGLWRTTTFSLKMCTSSARSSASKCCSAAFFVVVILQFFSLAFRLPPSDVPEDLAHALLHAQPEASPCAPTTSVAIFV